MSRRLPFLFLNLGHALDHFVLLIYPTAVLALHEGWGMSYAEALALGTASFVMFAAGTLPSGWLGDRWSKDGMMAVFFLGTGVACVLTGLASGPLALTLGLGLIGLFASIYHPVATAMIVQRAEKTGRALGLNGVFGNLGVAAAAGVTGVLTAWLGWRTAFIAPGLAALALGLVFTLGLRRPAARALAKTAPRAATEPLGRADVTRIVALLLVLAFLSGVVFNGTTIALPKLFQERLAGSVEGVAGIGLAVSLAFGLAAFSQLAVGHLLDRLPARGLLATIQALQVLALLLVGALAGPAIVPAATLMMILVFGAIPIPDWLIGRHIDPAWQSRLYALKFVVALSVSAVAVPGIALLHGLGGFALFFVVLALAAASACLVALLLPGARRTLAPVPA